MPPAGPSIAQSTTVPLTVPTKMLDARVSKGGPSAKLKTKPAAGEPVPGVAPPPAAELNSVVS